MSGASAVLQPGVPATVAPGGYISFEIETGQRLRLTQPQGEQVADFISFNRDDVRELLSMHSSRAVNLSWKFTAPDTLYSNRTREMWKIEEDLTRENYCGGGFCSEHLKHRALRRGGKGCPELPVELGGSHSRLRHGSVELQRRCVLQYLHDGRVRCGRQMGDPPTEGQAGRLHDHARADAADRRHVQLSGPVQRLQQLPSQTADAGDFEVTP